MPSDPPVRRRRTPQLAVGGWRRLAEAVLAGALALGLLATGPVAPGVTPTAVDAASLPASCEGGDAAQGVDVSFYQGTIDWPTVARAGVNFGMARIADGLTFPDATFQANYAGMRANGIVPGSYLFFEPGQDATAQAEAIVTALTKAGFAIGDLPPAIDVEVTGGQSPATIAAKVRTAITTIQSRLGVTPFIYASPGQWARQVGSPEFGDVPLWIAHWLVACPTVPRGWDTWSLWQYSSTGFVPGIPKTVDLDQSAGPSLPVYTGAPVFPGLTDITAYALGPTPVTYPVRAVGFRGAAVPGGATCDPPPGATFALGTRTVTCTARNEHGVTTASFRLTVQLAAAPFFDAAFPADTATIAAGPSGTPVALGAITARNYDGGRLAATCSPPAGSAFPVGRTSVWCVATDSFGRSAGQGFAVTVGYRFAGLFAPLVDPVTAAAPAAVVPVGSAVPVRFALQYADGKPIADTEAAALARACGALVWMAPAGASLVTAAGTLSAEAPVLACARYDATTHRLGADLPTAGLAPGDHTILVTITDREGTRLASHVAGVTLR